MNAFEEFMQQCEADGVTLLPHQRRFAESIFASESTRQFFMGGLGSGRTFVTERIARFYDQRRADAN